MFFDHTSFFTFVIASVVILIVPGPSVTVIVANSLKYGVKAGRSEHRRNPGRTGYLTGHSGAGIGSDHNNVSVVI